MDLQTVDRRFDNGLLPTPGELDLLCVGMHVQLALESGSRFWARLIEIRSNGTLVGRSVDTVPGDQIKKSDTCFFERQNIFGLV